jgi:hypothetical protein
MKLVSMIDAMLRRRFLVLSLGATLAPSLLRAQVLPRHEVPWLAVAQRTPSAIPAGTSRLSPLLIDDQGRPIRDLKSWRPKREAIRRWWLDFLRPNRADRKDPPLFRVIEEDRPDGVVRERIQYEGERDDPTEAYVLRPAKDGTNRPGFVVLHPTVNQSIREPAGVEGRPQMAFGLNLARRGWVAICPRNYLWPTNSSCCIVARGFAI